MKISTPSVAKYVLVCCMPFVPSYVFSKHVAVEGYFKTDSVKTILKKNNFAIQTHATTTKQNQTICNKTDKINVSQAHINAVDVKSITAQTASFNIVTLFENISELDYSEFQVKNLSTKT